MTYAATTGTFDIFSSVEFLKYGPVGLAGLMLVLVIVALMLGRMDQKKIALMRLFLYVGAFCFVVASVSAYMKDAQETQRDKRLNNIRQIIVQLDNTTMYKLRAESNPAGIDPVALRLLTKDLCDAVSGISREAGDVVVKSSCTAELEHQR